MEERVMGDKTGIEWTDATWTPIRARNLKTGKVGWHCEHKSEACRFCYAERINRRLGTGLDFKPGHRSDIELFLDEDMLWKPVGWNRPRMVFVCSMTDLFADFVEDDWVGDVWDIMRHCPQHTFQVLTKRPGRMLMYLISAPAEYRNLPNVWLGVSAEDQAAADGRIPALLETAAAKRFVSYEPALGPVDFTRINYGTPLVSQVDALRGVDGTASGHAKIDWIIAGGESGPKARPAHPDWFRSVRDQCQAAGVPFFFKQWGNNEPLELLPDDGTGTPWRQSACDGKKSWCLEQLGKPREELRPVEYYTVRKKDAGALLDGREWRGMPSYAKASEGRPE